MRTPPPPKGRPDPRRREPLWDRVDRNRVVLLGYVVLFIAAVVLVFDVMFLLFGGCLVLTVLIRSQMVDELEWLLGQRLVDLLLLPSMLFASAAALWSLFALTRSEKWLLRRFEATFVAKGELMPTKMALKDMAIAGGLKVAPALYLLDTDNVNAFVFAARHRRAVVGVTRGLTERLDEGQQRAVFANLIARLIGGDVIVDTGVAALMWPLHAWRDRQLYRQNDVLNEELLDAKRNRREASEFVVPFFFFGVALAIVAEVFAFSHRRRQLRASEKADAEGMLLLKDPQAMLSALERCVELNNVVVVAGEAFADLFYCWTGDSSDDEDDPEWERVARLREVLGVEGYVAPDEPLSDEAVAPPAPRLLD